MMINKDINLISKKVSKKINCFKQKLLKQKLYENKGQKEIFLIKDMMSEELFKKYKGSMDYYQFEVLDNLFEDFKDWVKNVGSRFDASQYE